MTGLKAKSNTFVYKGVLVNSVDRGGRFDCIYSQNYYFICPVVGRTVWQRNAASAKRYIKKVLTCAV